jgi:hypothetical protein
MEYVATLAGLQQLNGKGLAARSGGILLPSSAL